MEYISSADQRALNERYRLTAMVVVAIGLSILLYLLLPTLIPVAPTALVETVNWTKTLYSATLLLGLVVVLTRRALLSRTVLGRAARQGTSALLGRLSLTSIVCAALAEIVGVLGVFGYLLTGESYSWPVGVVSLLLVVYSFPRRGEWLRALATSENRGSDGELLERSNA